MVVVLVVVEFCVEKGTKAVRDLWCNRRKKGTRFHGVVEHYHFERRWYLFKKMRQNDKWRIKSSAVVSLSSSSSSSSSLSSSSSVCVSGECACEYEERDHQIVWWVHFFGRLVFFRSCAKKWKKGHLFLCSIIVSMLVSAEGHSERERERETNSI